VQYSESESEELSLLEDVSLVETLDSSLSSSPLIVALSLGGVEDPIAVGITDNSEESSPHAHRCSRLRVSLIYLASG
jgi:hypothetical protein